MRQVGKTGIHGLIGDVAAFLDQPDRRVEAGPAFVKAEGHASLAPKALESVGISRCFTFEPRKKDAKNYP